MICIAPREFIELEFDEAKFHEINFSFQKYNVTKFAFRDMARFSENICETLENVCETS